MEKFHLKPEEKLLVNDVHSVWLKTDKIRIEGQMKLTDKRLVFVKNAVPFGGLIFKSMKSQILFEYPLESIKQFSREVVFKSERLVIDNGFERPKKFESSKLDILEAELKRLTEK